MRLRAGLSHHVIGGEGLGTGQPPAEGADPGGPFGGRLLWGRAHCWARLVAVADGPPRPAHAPQQHRRRPRLSNAPALTTPSRVRTADPPRTALLKPKGPQA